MDENEHPRGALLFMLGYLLLLAVMWIPWSLGLVAERRGAYGPTLLRLATTTPLTTPGFRVW